MVTAHYLKGKSNSTMNWPGWKTPSGDHGEKLLQIQMLLVRFIDKIFKYSFEFQLFICPIIIFYRIWKVLMAKGIGLNLFQSIFMMKKHIIPDTRLQQKLGNMLERAC